MNIKLTPPQMAILSKSDFLIADKINNYSAGRPLAPRTCISIDITNKEVKDLKLWAVNKLITLQQTFKIMDANHRLETKHAIQSIMNLIKKLS